MLFSINFGVGEFNLTPISGREFYFDDVADKKYIRKEWWGMFDYAGRAYDAFSFMERNMDIKYGTSKLKDYKKITDRRLKKWGLNTYGAWTSLDILETPQVPYALIGASNMAKKLKVQFTSYSKATDEVLDNALITQLMITISRVGLRTDNLIASNVIIEKEKEHGN